MNFVTHISELLTSKYKFLHRPEFSPAGQFFALRLQASIFIKVINVWPRANWEMVTNNLTAVIEVMLTYAALSKALL